MKDLLALFCAPTWIEAEAAADGKPAGLPRFSMVAYTGAAIFQPTISFRHNVVVDLSGVTFEAQKIPIRLQHGALIGHTESVGIVDGQIVAAGVLSFPNKPEAQEVVAGAKNGFPWQASIGGPVEKLEFIPEKATTKVNGREFSGPIFIARKSTVKDISFVDLGADGKTSARVAASKQGENAMNFSDWLKAKGWIEADVTADQRAILEAAYKAETTPPQAPAAPVTPPAPEPTPGAAAKIRAEAIAEEARIEAVRKVCGDDHPEIKAKAISEGWDQQRAELEVLRADRPAAPAIIRGQAPAATGLVLEAALAQASKFEDAEKVYKPEILEAADRQFKGRIGLQEFIILAAEANGYKGRSFKVNADILRAAFRPELRAGFSTVDIAGILSSLQNKNLLSGFMFGEQSWRKIAAIRPVKDFKTATSYRLTGNEEYKTVPPGGEIEHGTLGQASFTNKANTYGLQLVIDRTDIINDDLGALSTVPQKLGRGASLKLNSVFWTAFLANTGNFFHADNNNYIEGATTLLGFEGLRQIEVAFAALVDAQSKPIGTTPKILLVPPAIHLVARQLFTSQEMRDTTASKAVATGNPFQGQFEPVASRYLTANSTTAFYLLADPREIAAMEVLFLDGKEAPTIETAEADFDVLGIRTRGFHDFGCALLDPKAGVKSKGSA